MKKGVNVIIARSAVTILAVFAVVLTTGCASMTGTNNQSVSIQTLDQGGKELPGAACELGNNKGKWFITTPGSTTITRSNDDMQVVCKKERYEPGRASVVSATKGSMFGNIILGGGIGAIVDHNTGAAYEYPAFFQVLMGKTTRVEPPKDGEPQAAAVPPANAPTGPGGPQAPAVSLQAPVDTKLTAEDRLKELKRLHAAGLIDTNVYLEQQRKILDGTP